MGVDRRKIDSVNLESELVESRGKQEKAPERFL